jgi:hypothetical protein
VTNTVRTGKNDKQAIEINIHKTTWVISNTSNGAQMEGNILPLNYYLRSANGCSFPVFLSAADAIDRFAASIKAS